MKTDVTAIPFEQGEWNSTLNVYSFVVKNITPYTGNSLFLSGPSAKTTNVWNATKEALAIERANNGVLGIDTEVISNITAFRPGYIKKEDEVIVGLQTDVLLKRALKPFGGIKLVESAAREH